MPLGRTQSIVAIDRKSGEIGAAILSQSFSIGSKAIWSEPGVGIVVAQGTVDPGYGPLGLALLKVGKTPPQALKSLLATDPKPSVRQVMIIDSRGRTAAHTGKSGLPEAGSLTGRGFGVQASFVDAKRAWKSMSSAFRETRGMLSERLLSALEAGERSRRAGRGGGRARSAAIVTVSTMPSNTPWEGMLDLRIDNSDNPLRELRELVKVSDAYDYADSGEELLSKGDMDRGSKAFAKALSLAPEYSELKLWFALAMMRRGETKKAESMWRSALGRGQDFKGILRELAARGIVPATGKSGSAQ